LCGDLACYSFNDYKHLSCGDGGLVATRRADLGPSLGKWGDKSYDRVAAQTDPALLRNPANLAPNYRITELQAAVAAAQLDRLPEIAAQRARAGARLTAALAAAPGIFPPVVRAGDTHSYWFYLLRLELARFRADRAQFVAALRAEGVEAGAGYLPMPVYRYRVFQNHDFFGGAWPVRDARLTAMDYRQVTCPVAEAILDDCVVLPVNEAMNDRYLDQVAHAVATVARRLVR
jgi:dTDP-4-amino-4,6-dideoxygalactose transaminase